MKPVIVKIFGGLGNQMFQYAMAKSKAIDLNTNLLLDIRDLSNDKLRKFSLDYFELNYSIAGEKHLNSIDKNIYQKFQNKFPKVLPKNSYIFQERNFNYDKNIFLDSKPRFYKGYWQSYHYFAKNKQKILNEFKIREKFIKNIDRVSLDISNSNSVSIHVRRGDYIDNPEIFSVHGVGGFIGIISLGLFHHEKGLIYGYGSQNNLFN